MNQLLERIAQNPVLSVMSLFLGFLGVILALVFYLKSRRFKALRYQVESRTIVEDLTAELDGLEVRYRQFPQERITVSHVFVWNNGTDTISASDLTSVDPLRIELKNGALLLDSRVVWQTDPANQLTIETAEHSSGTDADTRLNITFDYLDRSDGATIQLVHTGPRAHPIRMNGKVKGAESVERILLMKSRGMPAPVAAIMDSTAYEVVGALFYLGAAIACVVGFLRDYARWYLVPFALFGLFGAWIMFLAAKAHRPRSFRNSSDQTS